MHVTAWRVLHQLGTVQAAELVDPSYVRPYVAVAAALPWLSHNFADESRWTSRVEALLELCLSGPSIITFP
jgi:hypothetical protein